MMALTRTKSSASRLATFTAATALLVLGGCSPDFSPNTYNAGAVQQANKVEQGVVVGVRAVDVKVSGNTGAAAGAAVGGIAGSQLPGSNATSAIGAVGGGLLGGLLGSGVERAGGDTKAFEYIVRKPNNELVSVTQTDNTPLALGQRVLVIAGSQARIVADYTTEPPEPVKPPPPKTPIVQEDLAPKPATPAEAPKPPDPAQQEAPPQPSPDAAKPPTRLKGRIVHASEGWRPGARRVFVPNSKPASAATRLRQCVILVGGRGTRLGSLTAETPKPVLPVGDRPFLAWLLRELQRYGFEEALLLSAHLSETFRQSADQIAKTLPRPMRIVHSVEPSPAGTGGALFHARHLLDERFLLCNGDSLFDGNLAPFIAAANEPGVIGRLLLTHLPNTARYGVVTTQGHLVTGFHGPSAGAQAEGTINTGIYTFHREIVAHLCEHCSLERDVLPRLAAHGLLRADIATGNFIDIGIPADLERARTEIPNRLHRPALFLDRDGVINVDHGYVGTVDRFEFTATARQAVAQATAAGWHVFIVTNQSGIARGLYTEHDLAALHDWLQTRMLEAGGTIDDIRHCPFHPEAALPEYRRASAWRKPQPGMLLDLIRAWELDPKTCLLIGDQQTDLQAAHAAGIEAHLFQGGDLLSLTPPLADCIGTIDFVDPTGVVEGWCWCPEDPASRTAITLRINGVPAATALCDAMRPDLLDRGIGDGAYGFVLILPDSVIHGTGEAELTLHEAETGQLLDGPRRLHPTPASPAASPHTSVHVLEGNLDGVTAEATVSGWCWYPLLPATRVDVVVSANGHVLGTTRAAIPRPDLKAAAIGTGAYGFSFPLPRPLLETSGQLTISVADAATGQPFGIPCVTNLGSLAATHDTIADLEHRLQRLQTQVDELSAEPASGSDTQSLFATLSAVFAHLAAPPEPATPSQGLTLAIPATIRATIVIPATESPDCVAQCLHALATAGIDRHAEIIVLAPKAAYADLAMLHATIRNLHLVERQFDHLAPCLATMARPDTPVIVMAAILRPERDWLETLLATSLCHPNAGIIGGRVIGQHDGLLRHTALDADPRDQPAATGAFIAADLAPNRHLRRVEAIGGFGFLISQQALAVLRGQPLVASPPQNLGDDAIDLCLQLRRAGLDILTQPAASSTCPDEANLSLYLPDLAACPARAADWHQRPGLRPISGKALLLLDHAPPDGDAGISDRIDWLQNAGFTIAIAITAPTQSTPIWLEGRGCELPNLQPFGSIGAWLQHGAPSFDLIDIIQDQPPAPALIARITAASPAAQIMRSNSRERRGTQPASRYQDVFNGRPPAT
eukprot:gene13327-13441_t